MQSAATTVSAYLKELPADRRQALSKLRTLIRKAAPGAKEKMQYGMAFYELNGQLCALASQKNYVAVYVCEAKLVAKYKSRLGKASIGKGCIRFKNLEDVDAEALSELLREAASRRQTAEAR